MTVMAPNPFLAAPGQARGDVLQWGVNGQLVYGPDGWSFQPPGGQPGPARGAGPDGLVHARSDWYAWLRAHPQYLQPAPSTA